MATIPPELAALLEAAEQAARRSELAFALVAQREDELDAARQRHSAADGRLCVAIRAEAQAQQAYVDALRALGWVQTADGPMPRADAERFTISVDGPLQFSSNDVPDVPLSRGGRHAADEHAGHVSCTPEGCVLR